MTTTQSLGATLSDADLIAKLKRLVANEREATTELLRSLMEFDARRLYLGEGYPSLFAYCTQVLHYAEHAALNRIEVARAARRLPALLEHIADGRLHLTGARLLAPHLTDENAEALLSAARYKSKREIEELIAALKPRPDAASLVRKLPAPESTGDCRSRCALSRIVDNGTPAPSLRVLGKSTPPGPARDAACTGTLQSPVHDQPRNARQAAPGPGPDASRRHRMVILRRFLIERSRCCSRSSSARSSPRPQPRAALVERATTQRPHPCRRAAGSVAPRRRSVRFRRFPRPMRRNVGSWSSITSCRSQSAARRRSKISNCAAVRTTPMKRRSFLPRKTRVFWRP